MKENCHDEKGIDKLPQPLDKLSDLNDRFLQRCDPEQKANLECGSPSDKGSNEVHSSPLSKENKHQNDPFDCLIIGAGQAGLTLAQQLQDRYTYRVLERGQIGNAWEHRLEGMKLFTSRQFCQLPGLAFPGVPTEFPDCKEVSAYFKQYVTHHQLSIRTNVAVVGLEKKGSGFVVRLEDNSQIKTRSVVDCRGANQQAIIPETAQNLSKEVIQFTAENFTRLSMLPVGARVAVIGDGASGRQIAARLAGQHETLLATGKKRALLPKRILGKDIFWWINKFGVFQKDKNSLVARIIRRRNPIPCKEFNNKSLEKANVKIKPAFVEASGAQLTFQDESQVEVDAVVWCLGYQNYTQWENLSDCLVDPEMPPEYGLTPVEGLFILGRKWFSCRASELLLGIEKDSKIVFSQLEAFLNSNKVTGPNKR